MKKLALVLLGLILGFLLSYFFFPGKGEVTEPPVPKPPENVIKPDVITALDTTFNARHRVISDFIGRPDNRSSWYALKDVRDYLDFAEDEAKGLGFTMTGVRIYLGASEANAQGQPGFTTMFFVPTGTRNRSKGGIINFSFDGEGDIPGGSGLDYGGQGDPPNANYPQGNN